MSQSISSVAAGRARKPRSGNAVGSALVLAVLSASPALAGFADYETIQLNPTGAGTVPGTSYVGTGPASAATFTVANASGAAIGTATVYGPSGASVGTTAWYYSPFTGTTTAIGLDPSYPTVGYSYANSSGGGRSVSLNGNYSLNAAGYSVGSSNRFIGDAGRGADTWIYNPATGVTTRTGLSDGIYTSTAASNLGTRSSSALGANAAGQAIGTSSRYNAAGGTLGSDAWFYNPTTGISSAIPLPTAAGVTFQQASGNQSVSLSFNGSVSNSGKVLGTATAYAIGTEANLGTDVWLYDSASASTSIFGLTGAATATENYEASTGSRNKTIVRLTASGIAAGTTYAYEGSTYKRQQAWAQNVNSGGPRLLGLSGNADAASVTGITYELPGTSGRHSTAAIVTETGYVGGLSYRYTGSVQTGNDVYVHNFTSNSTVRVNPVGAAWENSVGRRSSNLSHISLDGDAAGTATRSNGASGTAGTTAGFYYNSSTAQTYEVGLSGSPLYVDNNGYGTTSISAINNTGLVAGQTGRLAGQAVIFNPTAGYFNEPLLGNDAFIFDSNTESQYLLRPDGISETDRIKTTVTGISDTGVAVGYYTPYDSGVALADKAFAWNAEDGFTNLSLLVDPSLSAEGWSSLIRGLTISPSGTIYASGVPLDFVAGSTGVLAIAVPEPAMMSALLLAAGGLLRRRR